MTTDKLLQLVGPQKIVKLNIFSFEGEFHLRISATSKKVKKLFNRTFGTEKAICKALIKHSTIHEGMNELTLKEFVDIMNSDKIVNKSRLSRSIKFAEKSNFTDLEEIDWSKFPSKNRRTKVAVRRILLKINHKYMKDQGYKSIEDLDMSALPIKGFKEKEIIKFFDN